MDSKKNDPTEVEENPVVDLEGVSDEDLVTINGGRDYGWRGKFGWSSKGGGRQLS